MEDGLNESEIAKFVRKKCNLSEAICPNFLFHLFADGYEVAFIARYRRDVIGHINVDQIRLACEAYQEAKKVIARKCKILQKLASLPINDEEKKHLKACLEESRSMIELEQLYQPFKTSKKPTLAGRAKKIGLEDVTIDLLRGRSIDLITHIRKNVIGRENLQKITESIRHIACELIHKNPETQIFIQKSSEPRNNLGFVLKVCSAFSRKVKSVNSDPKTMVYTEYGKFEKSAATIEDHQILALQRGEKAGILTWHVDGNADSNNAKFVYLVCSSSNSTVHVSPKHCDFLHTIVQDCFRRLVQPTIARRAKRILLQNAQKSAIDCFATNLRQLLLTPPLRNVPIIAIDPGFAKGCKVAFIHQSMMLSDGVFHLNSSTSTDRDQLFRRFLSKIEFSIHPDIRIAIGNGKGSREAAIEVSKMIKNGIFRPFHVKYCIISECGSSSYSISQVAHKEFPEVDIMQRSAVSIGRRLQDPLSEYVKIPPKHLGVGMYQHDCNEKQLESSLTSVVRDVVSSVRVDVNTCSIELLQNVSGLNRTTAANIVQYRREHNGRINSRKELLKVNGIGRKVFEKCAPFLNVYAGNNDEDDPDSGPPAAKRRHMKVDTEPYCPLDATMVPPESYQLALRIIKFISCDPSQIGDDRLRQLIETEKSRICATFTGQHQLSIVLEALAQPLHYDLRKEYTGPMFRGTAETLDKITVGDIMDGLVTNVLDFGAFVDVGLDVDGLVHRSVLGRNGGDVHKILKVNSHVQVVVVNVDLVRKRLALRLKSVHDQ